MPSIDRWGNMGYKEILLGGAIIVVGIIVWGIVELIMQINRFANFMMKK